MLHTLGCMMYSPPLERDIRKHIPIKAGSTWEVELRGQSFYFEVSLSYLLTEQGCSIWCVELIRREIVKLDSSAEVNAILIDYFLYDKMQELEFAKGVDQIPHHRTRSIWY